MAYARGGTHQHRRLVLFRQLVGGAHHGAALLGRRRIEHRHLGKRGETARVLLGLGRDGARIIGHVQHRAALHAHVIQRHQRIACHVQANLLARVQRARARIRRASQKLKRGLLVRRPFNVDSLGAAGSMFLRHRFDNLGRGRSRIPGANAHARLKGGMGKRFVAR